MNDTDKTLASEPESKAEESRTASDEIAACRQRGYEYLGKKQFAEAKTAFDTVIRLHPDDPTAYLDALLASLKLQSYDDLCTTPVDFTKSSDWINAYQRAGSLKQELDRILHQHNTVVHAEIGNQLYQKAKKPKDYDAAALEFAAVLRTDPHHADAVSKLIRCYSRYYELTGKSLALADDLRPDMEILTKQSDRYLDRLSIALFEEQNPQPKSKKMPQKSEESEQPDRPETPYTDDNGIEYRPDIEVEPSPEPIVPKTEQTAPQKPKKPKKQLNPLTKRKITKTLVALLIIAIVAGGAYYGINYKNICINRAEKQAELGNYTEAIELYQKGEGDDRDFIEMCYYERGKQALKEDNLQFAATSFGNALHYKDGDALYNETRYQYVMERIRDGDAADSTTAYDYLKDLKEIAYLDAIALYDEHYAWRLEDMYANYTKEEDDLRIELFRSGETLLVHFTVAGGPPSGALQPTVRYTYPDGETKEYTFDYQHTRGERVWFGWTDSFTTPTSGTLVMEFYDQDGNYITTYTTQVLE